MKFCYFDTIAGISGDMTLGALVSAGVKFDFLVEELKKLNLAGYELEAKHVERNGMNATKIDVIISEQPKYHRHYGDIVSLIDRSGLSPSVKERAKKIFREIAVAEAKVHQTTLEKVHFHEVGAIDSLVDIVGTAIGLEALGVDVVYSSPVKLGNGGFVNSQHGLLPVPTPATVEILRGYPTVLGDIPFELTTPTGAAIIKANSSGTLDVEHLSITAIGYGAGTRELEKVPNLLRVIIGDLRPEQEADEIVSVETNIDDMNPELYPFIIEQALAAGARDAFLVPVVMKKGRPGIVLTVLADPRDLDAVLRVVFRETTSIGVRIAPMRRRKLERTAKEVQTSVGVVRVKSVVNDGKEMLIPEYEECRRIALERKIPLKDVYRLLEKELAEAARGLR
ncbi:MAG TPA: nickel pincer cofactor biosynthesis protein LarC [Bacteroidota bacterium]|nr:nickel pincer cofactor biosynthesis protein LarC [Bacteroidota bacterium]